MNDADTYYDKSSHNSTMKILLERGLLEDTDKEHLYRVTDLGRTVAFSTHNEWRYRNNFTYMVLTREGCIKVVER